MDDSAIVYRLSSIVGSPTTHIRSAILAIAGLQQPARGLCGVGKADRLVVARDCLNSKLDSPMLDPPRALLPIQYGIRRALIAIAGHPYAGDVDKRPIIELAHKWHMVVAECDHLGLLAQ